MNIELKDIRWQAYGYFIMFVTRCFSQKLHGIMDIPKDFEVRSTRNATEVPKSGMGCTIVDVS